MSQPPPLFACLYVKEFAAQAILRLRPELHEKPCVVMEGEPPLQAVCSLNTRARLQRLVRGLTRVEVETFPNVVVLQRSPETEKAARMALLECAGAFSPRVEQRSEQTGFLCGIDIAGTEALFGPPGELVRSLLQRTRMLGVSARITVSRNLETAACLAKSLSPRTAIRIVAPGEEALALGSLPLAILDLTDTERETFASWGIRTLAMLAALPEKELASRMGQRGRRLRQLALGECPHLFEPLEPPFTLVETIELDAPVELLESLLFVAGVMLDQLLLRAKARVLALATLTATLTLEGGSTHTRTVRPALPSTDKPLWLKLLHLDLEAHPPQTAILAITLTAEPGSTSKVQLGLFSPQLPEASRLDVTLARIRALVGEENVGRAVLTDTHALDGFRMEPFVVPAGTSSLTASSHQRTAMRRLRPPEKIAITLHDGRPAVFFHRERRYQIQQAYGPWLVSGEWWSRAFWGLEQWDLVAHAQDETILCCCILHDHAQDRWQLAAVYD